MDSLAETFSASGRLKKSTYGLGITLLPLALIGGAQFLFARQIVTATLGIDPDVDAWAVSAFQRHLIAFYGVVASIVMGYWLLTALLCRRQLLGIRGANVTLMLSGAAFAFAILVASTVREPARYIEIACPFLRLSNEATQFGFDKQSACRAFANTATPLMLLGLPTILLATSAVQRILASRHRWPSADR